MARRRRHTRSMAEIEIVPRGPFSLAAARGFADGFPAGIGGGGVGAESITLAFPVEGTDQSAALELWQDADGSSRSHRCPARDPRGGAPPGCPLAVARSRRRRLACSRCPGPDRGAAQRELDNLRPVCFYSAYEAVTSFVIGQRIARCQAAVIKRDLADRLGDRPTVGGRPFRPSRGRAAPGAARSAGPQSDQGRAPPRARAAALDGRLDTEVLRTLPPETALPQLQELPGVGPFTAQGVYYRGCGVADGIPDADELGRVVVRDLYEIPDADAADVARLAEAWVPYRMWAVVLLRVAWGRPPGRTGQLSTRHAALDRRSVRLRRWCHPDRPRGAGGVRLVQNGVDAPPPIAPLRDTRRAPDVCARQCRGGQAR